VAGAADPAAAISGAALAGRDELCREALDIFVRCYGAEAGNLALKQMATGGVYLAGGIAPKLLERLQQGDFMQAFLAKGRMGKLMQTMPVRVVSNDRVSLLGAAAYARDRFAA
jgi:glucokinase